MVQPFPLVTLVRVGACVSLVLGAWVTHHMWPVATRPHQIGSGLIGLCLLTLLGSARLVLRTAPAWALAAPWTGLPRVLTLGGLAAFALSPQLQLLTLVVTPIAAALALSRGEHPHRTLLWAMPLLLIAPNTPLRELHWVAPVLFSPWFLIFVFVLYLLLERGSKLTVLWILILGLAASARLAFILSVPEPIASYDSTGYVIDAYRFLETGTLRIGSPTDFNVRPPVFPAWMLLTLGLSRSYFVALVATHLGALVLYLGLSLAVRARLGEVAGLHTLFALSLCPELLFYEHSLMSEIAFVVAMGLLSITLLGLGSDAERKDDFAVRLGLATAFTVLARSAALFLVPAVLLLALVRRWPRRPLALLLTTTAGPLLVWSSYNLITKGFFGLSHPLFKAIVLFGVSAPALDFDSTLHAGIKAEMRPSIERHNERQPWWNPETNQMMWAADGPISTSPSLLALPLESRAEVLNELNSEAIRGAPVRFALRAGYQFFVRYLGAPYHESEFHFPSWDEFQDRRVLLASVPEQHAHLLAPPSAIEGVPRAQVFEPLTSLLRPLNLSTYKNPWILLAVVAVVLVCQRFRDLRWPAIVLALTCAAIMGLTCLVQEPIPRYRLQTYVQGVLLVSILLRSVPGPSPTEEPPHDSGEAHA